jgi:hypothetical protein
MKTTNVTLTAMALLTPFLFAEEKGHEGHDHDDHSEKTHADVATITGPNEGRILTSTEPHAEFFITPERKVKITFVDGNGKAISPEEATISAIGGSRSAPTRMTFAKDGDSFISDKALPEGKLVPIILQIKVAPDADNVTEKFSVDFADCPTCKHLEYACTCGH